MIKYQKSFLITGYFIVVFLLSGCSKSLINQKTNNTSLVFWNYLASLPFFETISAENTNYSLTELGNIGDIPVYGDFSGDGVFDFGTYKNTEGGNSWTVIDSKTKSTIRHSYGQIGDLPIPNDYDGDGKFDFVVYRPKNSGFYGYLSNKNKLLEVHFGIAGDIPVPKDYDGDGLCDLATYRLASGIWQIKSSRNGLTKYIKLGGSEYLPIPADYDGDGKADLTVWNYKKNDCSILFSSSKKELSKKAKEEIKEKLRGKNYFPLSSDFDGNKKSELAFWDYEKKLIHVFKVSSKDAKYTPEDLSFKDGAEPINYYLLKKYLILLEKPTPSEFLRSIVKSFNEGTDFSGMAVTGDFDGDGKDEIGTIDKDSLGFNYFSSATNKYIFIPLNKRIEGIPYAFDLDFDFMADLIFYNPETNIFGILQSSNDYRYDEVSG